MRRIYIIGSLALLFASCKPSVNITTAPVAGNADFSNYLAIGNSLTAGYTDGSLTVSGQLNSYPERLFEQFSMVQGVHGAKGPFIQPLLVSDNGYPGPKYVLGMTYNPCIPADSSLGPISYPNWIMNPSDVTYTSPSNNGQINNIAVPGIRVADYDVAGYGNYPAFVNANPYAARFYHNAGTASPLDELQYRVGNLYPTFFTMWLGANDVLGYATAGGVGDGTGAALPFPGTNIYNTNSITPYDKFDSLYDKALNVAISTGAGGALINIPDITNIPFFTTVPANGLILTRQGQADTLNARWGLSKIFQVGANYFIIQDNNGIRQAVPGELILLTTPQSNFTCLGWGSTVAIPQQYVLTTDEIQNIRRATASFNSFIQYEATRHNLAYVDMNKYLSTITTGVTYNGIKYTAEFVTGGAFSLDGIHLTQRGYAMVANQVIAAINAKYNSTVPSIDVNKYHGINFP